MEDQTTPLTKAEVPLGARRVAPNKRAGAPGFAVHGGYLVESERNRDLIGVKKFETYSELLANIEVVAASVRLFLRMVGRASWSVVPCEEGGEEGERIAELVESIIYDLERPWHRVVRRSAMYQVLGYSMQEWIAKRRTDGVIGFFDIEPRSQSTITRWDVDDQGIVRGVWQESPQTFEQLYIPRSKVVYVVDDSISDSPEGLGVMRHVAPAGKRLQRYEQLEGIGFESDLHGVPVGRAPLTALAEMVNKKRITQAQANSILDNLESFVTDHIRSSATGLIIDSATYKSQDDASTPSSNPMWGIDLLKADVSSQEAIAEAINRLTRGIARVLASEGLLLGESGSGSLAMAKSKAQTFSMVVDAALIEVAEAYEKDLLRPLAKLNGWNPAYLPTLLPEKMQDRDVAEIMEGIVALSRAGAPLSPEDPAIDVARDMLGLPPTDKNGMAEDLMMRTPLTSGDLEEEEAEELEESDEESSSIEIEIEDEDEDENTSDGR
jgi:hypothetical protein